MIKSYARREFLATATAAALASSGARVSTIPPSPLPTIDTHVHVWELSKFHLAWLKPGSPLHRDFRWDDYREATEGLNVAKAIYMEVDVDPAQHEREARTVAAICRRGDTALAAAVISGRPASESFANYIRPLAKEPTIKGLRHVLHGPGTPAGYCLRPDFVRGIRLLGELGLSFDLCMRPAELRDGAKLAEACPETRFVLDHCGNAPVFGGDRSAWEKDIAAVAAWPNVSGKVSGIVASTKGHPWRTDDLAPIINHVLEVFGPDRVVFGGDWPVCLLGAPLARWVAALREVVRDRSEAEQRKLFHDNAVRVYRLP
jgi:L-fuconolactonase